MSFTQFMVQKRAIRRSHTYCLVTARKPGYWVDPKTWKPPEWKTEKYIEMTLQPNWMGRLYTRMTGLYPKYKWVGAVGVAAGLVFIVKDGVDLTVYGNVSGSAHGKAVYGILFLGKGTVEVNGNLSAEESAACTLGP